MDELVAILIVVDMEAPLEKVQHRGRVEESHLVDLLTGCTKLKISSTLRGNETSS